MPLKDKTIMPPPWLACPEMGRYSIGWRIRRYGSRFWSVETPVRFRRWAERSGALTRPCGTEQNIPLYSMGTGANSAKAGT